MLQSLGDAGDAAADAGPAGGGGVNAEVARGGRECCRGEMLMPLAGGNVAEGGEICWEGKCWGRGGGADGAGGFDTGGDINANGAGGVGGADGVGAKEKNADDAGGGDAHPLDRAPRSIYLTPRKHHTRYLSIIISCRPRHSLSLLSSPLCSPTPTPLSPSHPPPSAPPRSRSATTSAPRLPSCV